MPLLFDVCVQLGTIVANKDECKALGTSAQQETKLTCATIPADFGDEF